VGDGHPYDGGLVGLGGADQLPGSDDTEHRSFLTGHPAHVHPVGFGATDDGQPVKQSFGLSFRVERLTGAQSVGLSFGDPVGDNADAAGREKTVPPASGSS